MDAIITGIERAREDMASCTGPEVAELATLLDVVADDASSAWNALEGIRDRVLRRAFRPSGHSGTWTEPTAQQVIRVIDRLQAVGHLRRLDPASADHRWSIRLQEQTACRAS